MNKYSDYLEVVDFPSEINPSSIKESSFDWKKTYPHKTFIDLLKATELMLSRQSSNCKKSLWIHGAYGTGKSRIVWTLKTLLECSEEDFNEYFSCDELKNEADLREKLLWQRSSGKIITAYRYATGDIENFDDFILAIYNDVAAALKKAKVPYEGEDTLKGGIINWLEDDIHRNFFNNLIQKPEYRSFGSFAGKSADDILTKLKNPNAKPQELIRDILALAKKEGISTLSKTVDDLQKWLTDVIDQNHLKAIVFFWDEFSEFFRKNKNYLDTFQKFNELSNHKPFNMVIVTHNALFDENDQDGRKVRDRFNETSIELPDSIGFNLIDHVIEVKKSKKKLWEDAIREIEDAVADSRRAVAKFVWKDEQKGIKTLNGMLPLHPMAALMLKYISERFASNQRSMFNFIKNPDTDELQAFQWFINTHSPDMKINEDDSLLTIDHLWNFFYEKGTDDYGSAMGRSSLDTQIRNILDSFAQNENRLLSNDDKRVLKTILMMQAMSEKLHNQIALFLPTEENLELAFDGVGLGLTGRAKTIALRLVQENILFKKPIGNSKQVFAATVVSNDSAKIAEIKENLRKQNDTTALVQNGGFADAIALTKSQSIRYKKIPVSLKDFTNTVNKITDERQTFDIKDFQIPLIMLFARTPDERAKLRKSLQEKLADERYDDLVFWDLTAATLSDDKYENLLEYKAQEEYYRPKELAQANNYSQLANGILKEWKDSIQKTPQTIYYKQKREGSNCQSTADVQKTLNDAVLKKHPLCFDSFTLTEQMWALSSSQPKSTVLLGINEQYGGTIIKEKTESFLNDNKQRLQDLKDVLKAVIQPSLKKEGRVSVGDLFDKLMDNGFMPCTVYAYLTGWLLREYADKSYRYSDGDSSNRMDSEKLAIILSEYIKHKVNPISRYKEKFIEILTPSQKAFVNLAHTIWGVSEDMSVEDVTFQVRSQLTKLDYPLWSINELDDSKGAEEFLGLLAQLANTNNSTENASNLVDKLGNMKIHKTDLVPQLKSLLTPENAKEGMRKFLSHFEDGILFQLAEEIQAPNVMLDVKRSFTRDGLWLWNQEVGEDVIQKLIVEYKIVALTNQMLSSKATSLDKAFHNWEEQIQTIKMPNATIAQFRPDVKALFKLFYDRTTDELPNSRYPELLKTLQDSKDAYRKFEDQKMEVFKEAYSYHLNQLSDEEIRKLYADLPGNLFKLSAPEAEQIISQQAKLLQEAQLYFKLRALWKEKTGTESPREWSEKHRTPILIMVPDNERETARLYFNAVNQKPQSQNVVRDAIEYLSKDREYFKNLNDENKINEAFQSKIVRNYASLLDNPDEVRDELQNRCTTNCYDWDGNSSIISMIEKMGIARYRTQGRSKALQKVEQMNDEQIKKLLLWLVDNSVESGIKIMTEYEG